jgi:hypothetical protein
MRIKTLDRLLRIRLLDFLTGFIVIFFNTIIGALITVIAVLGLSLSGCEVKWNNVPQRLQSLLRNLKVLQIFRLDSSTFLQK